MTECQHMQFRFVPNVSRVIKQEHKPMGADAPVEMYVFEMSVFCADCQMPFSFNWSKPADPNEVPTGNDEMKARPWVSFMNETLGVTISPMDQGGTMYGSAQQVGHA